MKRITNLVLIALALLATACMQDNVSPVNDPDIPQVSVDSETLTRISATLNGSLGKAEGIVAYGFEMTGTNFDDTPDRIVEVSGLDAEGRFSQTVEVKPGAYYAVRSFISDGHNKKYSKEVSLTVPSTSVATPSEVTILQDRLYADLVDDGGRTVREVGFCWSESPDVQTIRLTRIKGEWVDDHTFSARLPEMEEGHTYYFLAYAENAADAHQTFGYSRTPVDYLMTDERFVDIEDPVFRSYLLGRFDTNKDGKLTSKELAVVTDIAVNTDQIASVQGIEWMPNLSVLDCRGSSAGKGGLHEVDISRNPLLDTFLCANNQLTELDLSEAELLIQLDCRGNQLTQLDLSSCFRLTDLNCSGNSIDALDVTRTPYLRRLAINDNPLETIDVSYCTELNRLEASGCPELRWVYVSLEQYQTFPGSGDYEIPSSALFYPIFVPVKDDALYTYLMSVYDRDGDFRISASEAAYVTRIEICTENVSTMEGIEFFYNLEELICRSCREQYPGRLTDLDLSRNRKITHLDCHGNQLTTLDVSGLTSLNYLDCSDNRLSQLDISRNYLLKELNIAYNSIGTIDLSHCPLLDALDCSANGIASLDLSHLVGLTGLKCPYNQLGVLDISHNGMLTTLWCQGNMMTYIDVTNNGWLSDVQTDNVAIPDSVFKSYLVSSFDTEGDGEISLVEAWRITDVEVETQQIYSMEGIQYFPNLQYLICGGGLDPNGRQARGRITSLDLSQNPKLIFLDCRYTSLESLDLSHNPKLQEVTCVSNSLTSLDVSNLSELTYLDCALNSLGTLDVSHNPKLFFLHCQYAELQSLNLSNNPGLRELYANNNELESLNVTGNPNLERLEFAWNSVEEIDISRNTKLVYLDFRWNPMSTLDVSNCPLMNYLDGTGNGNFYQLTLRSGQEITTLLLDSRDSIEFIYI